MQHLSDHLPQILIVHSEKLNAKRSTKYKYYQDFSRFDKEEFILDFLALDWDIHFKDKCAESRTKTFIDLRN